MVQGKELVKKYLPLFLLLVILGVGFYLRSYHIDYPVVGYHNMKEAHTLGEMYYTYIGESKAFENNLIYTIDLENPTAIHMDNLPILSWIAIPIWSVFGPELWVARLIIILFSMGVVIFTYLLTKELFKSEWTALLSAFLVAIMPILVFFGRNVQYDVPALFFMMGAAYFYARWRRTEKGLVLFSIMFVIAGLVKLPFTIILLPIIATFPYKKLKDTKKWTSYIFDVAIPMLLVPLFMLYSNYVQNKFPGHGMGAFKLSELYRLFTADFWRAVYTYAIVDNFTQLGLILAGIGLVFCIFKIKKWQYRFCIAWLLSYVVYAAASPIQQTGHSYYQIPYAPLICILISMVVLLVINTAFSFLKHVPKNYVIAGKVACLVILMVLWFPALRLSTTRQFDTIFPGIDIAGEYIGEHTLLNETYMGSGHQSRGSNWHAKRRSYDFTTNVTRLQEREDALNITHLFLYQWGFDALVKPDMLDYIQNNYHLVQIAFLNIDGNYNPLYTIYAGGCCYNHSDINSYLIGKAPQTYIYGLTGDKAMEVVVVDVVT